MVVGRVGINKTSSTRILQLDREEQRALWTKNPSTHQYPPLWPVLPPPTAEWQYTIALRNIYDCLRETPSQDNQEGQATSGKQGEDSEDEIENEARIREENDDIENVNVLGNIVKRNRLTRNNLVGHSTTLNQQQKLNNIGMRFNTTHRPPGWHIQQVDASDDEVIETYILVME
jgi:chromatin segregation and condensation protein Rec8/ScpA/Scc1 (kleisin family)